MTNFSDPIPYELLVELHRNYRLTKRRLLTRDLGNKEETKSIHFEKNDTLIDFLSEIITDPIATGLRIYLCAYDEVQSERPSGKVPKVPQHLRQLTVGLVATRLEGGKQVDYVTREKVLTLPLNHGTLCPPDSICPE